MATLRVTSLRGRTAGTSPELPDGAVVTGIVTATGANVTGIVTAVSFSGDGSGLSGVGGQLDITSSLFT